MVLIYARVKNDRILTDEFNKINIKKHKTSGSVKKIDNTYFHRGLLASKSADDPHLIFNCQLQRTMRFFLTCWAKGRLKWVCRIRPHLICDPMATQIQIQMAEGSFLVEGLT